MKGYRFYIEYPNNTEKNKATVKNLGNHSGNCIAVLLDEKNNPLWCGNSFSMDAITNVFDRPNSPCSLDGVHRDYLRTNCKRIPERLVKEIHPKLWNYINQ